MSATKKTRSQSEDELVDSPTTAERSPSLQNCTRNNGEAHQPDHHELDIRPRNFYKYYVSVPKSEGSLKWAFRTTRKGISFGLFYLYDGSVAPAELCASLKEAKVKMEPGPTASSVMPSRTSSLSSTLAVYGHMVAAESGSIVNGNSSASIPNCAPLTVDASSKMTANDYENVQVGEMIEVMPIERFDTDEQVVKGVLVCPLAGTWVLYFDNSFSSQTSKHLHFAVLVGDVTADLSSLGISTTPPPASSVEQQAKSEATLQSDMVFSGWLLKKKRRRLPGWSHRWFQLDSHSTLSYYERPGLPCRGAVALLECTVSKVPSRRLITVDSGMTIFHLRAVSEADYQAWSKHLSDAILSHLPAQAGATGDSAMDLTEIEKRLEQAGRLLFTGNDFLSQEASRESLAEVYRQLCDYTALLRSQPGTALAVSSSRMAAQTTAYHATSRRPSMHDAGAKMDEDYFYDVEEIILSDVSDSEYGDVLLPEELPPTTGMEGISGGDRLMMPPADELPSLSSSSSAIYTHGLAGEEMEQPSGPAETPPHMLHSAWPLPGHRSALPVPAPTTVNISMASILKRSIGKDWSSVAMPVAINEPLNALQRLAEDLEYSELLDRAASQELFNDSLERLVYVTCFAVSAYSCMPSRVDRKPFNPMLGETYELDLPERGFRFHAEKVSHRPVIVAAYAASIGPGLVVSGSKESCKDDGHRGSDDAEKEGARWTMHQDQAVKSGRFWGKSMEYIPSGHITVTLPRTGDIFRWAKVISCVRNFLTSSKWIEFYGEMRVTNEQTGDYAKVTFKSNGLFGSANGANEVIAQLFGSDGRKAVLKGRWDAMMCRELPHSDVRRGGNNSGMLEVIWRCNQLPADYPEFFGFTSFARLLNESPLQYLQQRNASHPSDNPQQGTVLMKTDTRHRPDQRLLEEGRIDEAEAEKQRIEQKQRDLRAVMEAEGRIWTPQWFVPVESTTSSTTDKAGKSGDEAKVEWKSTGTYWRAREQAATLDLPDLW